jgi:hypothetical protein
MNTNAKKQQVSPWALNLSNFRALKKDRRNVEPKDTDFSGKDRRDTEKTTQATATSKP